MKLKHIFLIIFLILAVIGIVKLIGSAEGDFIDSFSVSEGSSTPQGITQNETFIWTTDIIFTQVYKYFMNGTYTKDNFDTAGSGASNPTGIINNNTFFWITDNLDRLVYKYFMNGTYTSDSFDTSGNGQSSPSGIDIYGNFLWVIDSGDKSIGNYFKNGTIGGTKIDTSGETSTPTGVTTNGTFFWITDNLDDEIYKYYFNGTYTQQSFDTGASGNTQPNSITMNGTFFWISDGGGDVYKYELTADDLNIPSYTNANVNNTLAGIITEFYLLVDDNRDLHPNGQFNFSTNNTGIWVNESIVNFTSTPGWANTTLILNTTEELVIGYRWYITDNVGLINNTPIYTLITDDTTPPGITVVDPTRYQNFTITTIFFNATASESVGTWKLDYNGTNLTLSDINTSLTINQGVEHNLKLWVNDTSNNWGLNDTIFFSVDSIAPTINIIVPTSFQSFDDRSNIQFNVTEFDATAGLDTCWYSNNSAITNTTYTCGTNFSITEGGDGTFNVTVWTNDSFGNLNSDSVDYVVSAVSPAITINQPTDNSYLNSGTNINFNVTALDANGLSNCSLWTNSTGTWHLNETNQTNIVSGTEFKFLQNLSDNYYLYNFQCFDLTSASSFAGANFTTTIDTIFPLIDIDVITTKGFQTISFNATITELNKNFCKYSIYNSSNLIDSSGGSNENVTFNCGQTDISATTTAYGTFTLRVYSTDLADNINYTELEFTTSASSGTTVIGGGGSTTTVVGTSETFSILSINLQDNIDVSLTKDTVKSRVKEFIILNIGLEEIEVNVECSTEGVNRTKEGVNICDYVNFSQTNFLVSPNEKEPILSYFEILTPPNSTRGDQFYFNIIGTSSEGNSKLSVSTEVTALSIIRKWSNVGEKMYPVWIPALILSLVVLFGTFLLLRNKVEGAGEFLGLVLSFFTFFVILWLL